MSKKEEDTMLEMTPKELEFLLLQAIRCGGWLQHAIEQVPLERGEFRVEFSDEKVTPQLEEWLESTHTLIFNEFIADALYEKEEVWGFVDFFNQKVSEVMKERSN